MIRKLQVSSLSFQWLQFHSIPISGLGVLVKAVLLSEKLKCRCRIMFTYFRLIQRPNSPGCSNENCRKFSVDVQDVFIYCIWCSETKVMGQTASNSENQSNFQKLCELAVQAFSSGFMRVYRPLVDMNQFLRVVYSMGLINSSGERVTPDSRQG